MESRKRSVLLPADSQSWLLGSFALNATALHVSALPCIAESASSNARKLPTKALVASLRPAASIQSACTSPTKCSKPMLQSVAASKAFKECCLHQPGNSCPWSLSGRAASFVLDGCVLRSTAPEIKGSSLCPMHEGSVNNGSWQTAHLDTLPLCLPQNTQNSAKPPSSLLNATRQSLWCMPVHATSHKQAEQPTQRNAMVNNLGSIPLARPARMMYTSSDCFSLLGASADRASAAKDRDLNRKSDDMGVSALPAGTKLVLYKGSYMRLFRLLVRFKIFQLVGIAALAIPINTFLVEVCCMGQAGRSAWFSSILCALLAVPMPGLRVCHSTLHLALAQDDCATAFKDESILHCLAKPCMHCEHLLMCLYSKLYVGKC